MPGGEPRGEDAGQQRCLRRRGGGVGRVRVLEFCRVDGCGGGDGGREERHARVGRKTRLLLDGRGGYRCGLVILGVVGVRCCCCFPSVSCTSKKFVLVKFTCGGSLKLSGRSYASHVSHVRVVRTKHILMLPPVSAVLLLAERTAFSSPSE